MARQPKSAAEPAPPGTSGFSYHPALDGIRALAVLAVVAYHDGYGWARGGFLGVDAFFVLSGFLITTLLLYEYRRNDGIALAAFWARRARRLLPALLLVLVFVAIYTRFAVATWQRVDVRSDALASLFYVANWRFVFSQQSYFELFTGASPLRHMWSLAIEEQFYVVWPLVVLAALRLGHGTRRVLSAVCVVGLIGSILVMAATYSAADASRAYYGTDARAHTILIGALLALVLVGRGRDAVTGRAVQGLGIVAAVAVVVAWGLVSGTDAGYYHGGSVIYALAVAAVIAASLGNGLLTRALAWPPLVALGGISYGVYLWHWPINVWLSPARLDLARTPLNLVRLAVTFACAIASYHLLERPIRERRFRVAARPVFAVVAAAVVGVVLVGSASGATDAPRYAVAFGAPSACPEPSAAELRQARSGLDGTRPASDPPRRLLLVGDSIGCSLLPGLEAVGQRSGVRVNQAAVTGCGVVADETAPTNGEATMVGTDACRRLVTTREQRALARGHPDVVLWLSSWERMNLRVGSRLVAAGSRPADEILLSRMERAYHRLANHGTRLALLTIPPFTDGTALGVESRVDPRRDLLTIHLNDLLRRFAARHPDRIVVVDLARLVCPRGAPCDTEVDGRRPRPDGAHFSARDSSWAASWIVAHISRRSV